MNSYLHALRTSTAKTQPLSWRITYCLLIHLFIQQLSPNDPQCQALLAPFVHLPASMQILELGVQKPLLVSWYLKLKYFPVNLVPSTMLRYSCGLWNSPSNQEGLPFLFPKLQRRESFLMFLFFTFPAPDNSFETTWQYDKRHKPVGRRLLTIDRSETIEDIR